jgi:hypothetical protein
LRTEEEIRELRESLKKARQDSDSRGCTILWPIIGKIFSMALWIRIVITRWTFAYKATTM